MEASQTVAEIETPTNERSILPTPDAILENRRSSSLSDIGASDPEEEPPPTVQQQGTLDHDSEAETERVEDSPEKLQKYSTVAVSLTEVEPEQHMHVETLAPSHVENDLLSDSEISSRSPSPTDPMSAGFEEALMGSPHRHGSPKKRKRDSDDEEPDRRLRQRTGSVKSTSTHTSENEEDDAERLEEHVEGEMADLGKQDDDAQAAIPTSQKGKAAEKRILKKSKRLNPQEEQSGDEEGGEDGIDAVDEGDHDSDEEDDVGDVEEDAEAAAKSEEDALNQIAAMESLRILEKQFAILRDKLYDERISALQTELAQAKAAKPTHPELLRQLRCIQDHRDQKKVNEVRLWEYKVESLRKTSVAQKSIIDSSYFQHVRDIREKVLEQANESFCKIQNDRFRSEDSVTNYWVPFSTQRGTQVAEQTAYNKEISILSGMAKYLGFPAAPELETAREPELEDDLSKMGISPTTAQPARLQATPSAPATTPGSALLPRKGRPAIFSDANAAAEEQFLEQTPWANPHHPVHQHILSRQSRQSSTQSNFSHNYSTPAAQKKTVDIHASNGSASTIADNPSAPASSVLNMPYGVERDHVNGSESQTNKRKDQKSGYKESSTTPIDLNHRPSPPRSTPFSMNAGERNKYGISGADGTDPALTSPSTSRHGVFQLPSRPDSGPRTTVDHADLLNRHQSASSPLITLHQQPRDTSVTAGSGFGRFGVR